MNGMNEWLAEFYGTGQSQEDLEKSAQAALLEKLADDDSIDIDSLSDEDVIALADELGLLGEEGADTDISDREKVSMIQKVAAVNDIDLDQLTDEEFEQLAEYALDPANWEDEEETKEAEAKFAEADFLGRVMAHAQWDEMNKIAGVSTALMTTAKKAPSFLEKMIGRVERLGGAVPGGKKLEAWSARRAATGTPAARQKVRDKLLKLQNQAREAGGGNLTGINDQIRKFTAKLKGMSPGAEASRASRRVRLGLGGGAIAAPVGLAGYGVHKATS